MRVLGRVARFGDRLQLELRSLESADADPAVARPADAARRGRAGRVPRVPRRARSRTRGSRAVVGQRARRRGAARGAACAAGLRLAPLLRGRPARAHGRRRDARARDGAAPSAAARGPAARRGAAARPRAGARAAPRPVLPPDRGGPAARSRAPRPAADRGAKRGARRRTRAPSSCTPSRRITTATPPARPRRPSSTTRTSSTPSPPRGQSATDSGRWWRSSLALGASVVWGLGDFLGGLKSRSAARADGSRDLADRGTGGGLVLAGRRARAAAERGGARVGGRGGPVRCGRARGALPRDGDRRDGDRRADLGRLGGDPVRRRRRDRASARARSRWPGSCSRSAGVALASRQPTHLGGGRAAGRRPGAARGDGLRLLLRASRPRRRRERAVGGGHGTHVLLGDRTRRGARGGSDVPRRLAATCPRSSRSASATSGRTSSSGWPRHAAS